MSGWRQTRQLKQVSMLSLKHRVEGFHVPQAQWIRKITARSVEFGKHSNGKILTSTISAKPTKQDLYAKNGMTPQLVPPMELWFLCKKHYSPALAITMRDSI